MNWIALPGLCLCVQCTDCAQGKDKKKQTEESLAGCRMFHTDQSQWKASSLYELTICCGVCVQNMLVILRSKETSFIMYKLRWNPMFRESPLKSNILLSCTWTNTRLCPPAPFLYHILDISSRWFPPSCRALTWPLWYFLVHPFFMILPLKYAYMLYIICDIFYECGDYGYSQTMHSGPRLNFSMTLTESQKHLKTKWFIPFPLIWTCIQAP